MTHGIVNASVVSNQTPEELNAGYVRKDTHPDNWYRCTYAYASLRELQRGYHIYYLSKHCN